MSKNNENERDHPLLSSNLTVLGFLCMWPLQNESFLKRKYLVKFHRFIGYFIYSYFIIFHVTEYIELIRLWGNLSEMTTNLTVTCIYDVAMLQAYTILSNRKTLESLITKASKMERNILEFQDENTKIIVRNYIRRAKKLSYFFWLVCFSTMLYFLVLPPLEYRFSDTYHRYLPNGTEFWTYEKPAIFSSWIPFDKFAYPNYVFIYFYHLSCCVIGTSYLAIWQTFFLVMMIHSIGQMKVLRMKIADITNVEEDLDEKYAKLSIKQKYEFKREVDRNRHRKLVDCVVHHQYIFRYTRQLNDVIRPVIMGYFVICSMMICVIGFQLILVDISLRLFLMLDYLIAVFIQLFLLYWHGNQLIVETQKLFMATYNCKWYNANKSFKLSLIIFRECMKIPLAFTVGPFYPMCFPTFLAILRTSYSYFALLRQVQQKS